MRHGISCDAMNPYGRPTARSLKLLKVDGVRMVAFNKPMWFTYLREMEVARLDVAVVHSGLSYQESTTMYEQARVYAEQIDVAMHIIGNEWNVDIDATWPAGGDDAFVAVWNEIGSAIRSVRPDASLWIGGLFSEADPIAHLKKVIPRLDPEPTGIDYHPYMEGYEETADLFNAMTREFGLPVSAMEWNDSDPEGLKRFQKILNRTTDHSAWFCYDSRMVANHGVIDERGRRTPQWYALRDAYSA